MTLTNPKSISTPLRKLPEEKEFAFALLLLERMFPGLSAFARRAKFDASVYFKGKDAAWRTLASSHLSSTPETRALAKECAGSAPDTEEYEDDFASHALNTALAEAELLNFLEDHDFDHLSEMMRLSLDSIDLYVQSLDPSLISRTEIPEHPLIEEEYQRQLDDLEFLKNLSQDFVPQALERLVTRAKLQRSLLPAEAFSIPE